VAVVVAVVVEGGVCQVSFQRAAVRRYVSGPRRAEAVEAAAAVNLLWPLYESGPRRVVAVAAGAVVLLRERKRRPWSTVTLEEAGGEAGGEVGGEVGGRPCVRRLRRWQPGITRTAGRGGSPLLHP
jgi:hypothetical protein